MFASKRPVGTPSRASSPTRTRSTAITASTTSTGTAGRTRTSSRGDTRGWMEREIEREYQQIRDLEYADPEKPFTTTSSNRRSRACGRSPESVPPTWSRRWTNSGANSIGRGDVLF